MDSAQSRKAKRKGYQCEIRALRDLKPVFPRLRRVGSVGYPDRGGADLVQEGETEILNLLYTYDSHKKLAMVTLPVSEFTSLLMGVWWGGPVRIQCKARNGTRIGSLLTYLINSGNKK